MRNMKNSQSGFTLIELVMVIVILGILSAFALPRFADLGQEARSAAINGALGAVRSAAAISHSQALVSNVINGNVSLEGQNINMVNSYPDAETIDEAAQLVAADFGIAVNGAGDEATITLGACSFTYTEAAAGNTPTISVIANDPNC